MYLLVFFPACVWVVPSKRVICHLDAMNLGGIVRGCLLVYHGLSSIRVSFGYGCGSFMGLYEGIMTSFQ